MINEDCVIQKENITIKAANMSVIQQTEFVYVSYKILGWFYKYSSY